MKKSILLSLLVIGVVASLVVASSGAVFSDTVTSSGNTFTTGHVDLTVDTLCDEAAAPYGGPCDIGTVAFSGTPLNLKPGDSVSHDFVIANSGSLGFTYVTTPSTTGALWTCDATDPPTVTVSVTANGADGTPLTIPSSAAAQNETVRVVVALPAAAGNGCQGVSGALTLTFVATQS
jgi:predicted ribosomally synthesized peptide with SipW-like signal peptide